MKRYITRGKGADSWDYEEARPPTLSLAVIETNPEPVFTGLLDAAGNRLYSVNALDPIGFVRFK